MKAIATTITMVLVLVFGTARAQAQANPPLPLPATGSFPTGGVFEGMFELHQFVSEGGAVQAVGTLSGTLIDPLGAVIGTVSDVAIALPLSSASGTCQILHLELGPLDLDLLGLVVHLDRIVLDISAESGSGNLLGNLLCAVARLLDSGGSADALVRRLNRILSLL